MTCHGRHTESRFSIIVLKEHTQLAGRGWQSQDTNLGCFILLIKLLCIQLLKN